MNTDELAMLCSALSMKEIEGHVRTLDVQLKDKGAHRLSLCLVGKILATKLVNKTAFIDVMTSIWNVNGGFKFEWVEGNFFAFHFKNLEDRKRILTRGPWSFDRAMILFDEPTGEGDIQSLSFNRIEFWIQIHNIPFLCMTEEIGIFLGKLIGEVRDIDLEAGKGGNGCHLRVHVAIASTEPLMRSLMVDLLGTGKITTMLLRYERLLDYCFKCGRLGHAMRECNVEGDDREVTVANLCLSVWLRTVSPPKRFPFRSGRADHRPWNKQVGTSANIIGQSSNRSFGGKWIGKKVLEEENPSGDRGCIDPTQRCMETDKVINVAERKSVPGETSYDGVTITDGEN
ncbi:hypothetical protein Dsin_000716 [Dipteronia sinensis]|uniref:CCHC-type domain-containing protein n=1 Tax=Dipteronia sinensis TaxID=43782 RepID=A0AAE0EJM4_9ROSI|nr:hypothetical protein Dsin_000716 [Dipteronia sinensis]